MFCFVFMRICRVIIKSYLAGSSFTQLDTAIAFCSCFQRDQGGKKKKSKTPLLQKKAEVSHFWNFEKAVCDLHILKSGPETIRKETHRCNKEVRYILCQMRESASWFYFPEEEKMLNKCKNVTLST